MKKARSRKRLEEAVYYAKPRAEKALAYYHLGLFHDNNNREIEAIPNYEKAITLGLADTEKAKALAWLASSLYKTGNPAQALRKLHQSRALTRNRKMITFLVGLESRIKRSLM